MKYYLNWNTNTQLIGVIGEAVLSDWLKKREEFKKYKPWRSKPIPRESFRKSMIDIFSRFNLRNEMFYQEDSEGLRLTFFLEEYIEKCTICGKTFKAQDPFKADRDLELHLYKSHRDICRGYNYIENYFNYILYNKRIDNILVKINPLEEWKPRGKLLDKVKKIKTIKDFQAILEEIVLKMAPIAVEIKSKLVLSERRSPECLLSLFEKETKKRILDFGWGWLFLKVEIGKRLSAEDIELYWPNNKKIKQGIAKHFSFSP